VQRRRAEAVRLDDEKAACQECQDSGSSERWRNPEREFDAWVRKATAKCWECGEMGHERSVCEKREQRLVRERAERAQRRAKKNAGAWSNCDNSADLDARSESTVATEADKRHKALHSKQKDQQDWLCTHCGSRTHSAKECKERILAQTVKSGR